MEKKGDCNDRDETIYPGAPYAPGDDAQDRNCDGDDYSARTEDDRRWSLAPGCLSVGTNQAFLPLLLPLVVLQVRRRQARYGSRLRNP